MQQQLLFATRQSPDWHSLASDFKGGLAIDPARFRPADSIRGFPENIVELVELWNARMSVDFFSCRLRLKEIADETIAQLPGARRVSYEQVIGIGSDTENCVVFFHDDDDWFAPNLSSMLSNLSADDFDVCVFNLIRLWTDTLTLVRLGQQSEAIVGRQHDFRFRYQSNNYGLNGRICDSVTLLAMKDHVLASDYAAKRGFRDVYIEQIIGATVKTPCSASQLRGVFSAPDRAREQVERYVDALKALTIPSELDWIADRVGSVIQLFSAAAEPPRPVARVFRHGGIHYLEFLKFIGQQVAPSTYFEIGTSKGASVSRIKCDAICVDPTFQIVGNIVNDRRRMFLFQMTADEFFADYDLDIFFPRGVDLAFLDGLHRFEFLLRDFLNTERHCHKNSIILLHDCLPFAESIAGRAQSPGQWAGDVWKILPILKKFRPEIKVVLFDCPPTGLAACTNLNPASSVLSDEYHAIVAEFLDATNALNQVESIYPRVDTKWFFKHPENLSGLLPFSRARMRSKPTSEGN